jgi:hypothetical protein
VNTLKVILLRELKKNSWKDNFLIAVAQYEMRAYLVPDTATNAMNLVLRNLEVARQLGKDYINKRSRSMDVYQSIPTVSPSFRRIHDHSPPATRAALERSRVVPSGTITDARVALDIDDTVELTVDVIEAAFERNAAIMVKVGERFIGISIRTPILGLKNLRYARSLLLRSLE